MVANSSRKELQKRKEEKKKLTTIRVTTDVCEVTSEKTLLGHEYHIISGVLKAHNPSLSFFPLSDLSSLSFMLSL